VKNSIPIAGYYYLPNLPNLFYRRCIYVRARAHRKCSPHGGWVGQVGQRAIAKRRTIRHVPE